LWSCCFWHSAMLGSDGWGVKFCASLPVAGMAKKLHIDQVPGSGSG
jgi:hypothetical protein